MEEAEILYRQHPMQCQFDLAIIKSPVSGHSTAWDPPLSIAAPVEGEAVSVETLVQNVRVCDVYMGA